MNALLSLGVLGYSFYDINGGIPREHLLLDHLRHTFSIGVVDYENTVSPRV